MSFDKKEYMKNYQLNLTEERKDLYKKNRTKQRHALGISTRYNTGNGFYKTSEYKKLHRKKYKYRMKNAGELPIKRIQLVYEENIKKYGTLTCYLCLLPIMFGNDSLEHKTPISRGGTNEYENLEIACQPCNRTKNGKTENEYRGGLIK